jgi:predicted ATPase
VVSGGTIDAAEVPELIANLVAKSLVVVDAGGRTVQYRLLDTTRAYATERLVDSGERESLARHHAECYRRFSAHAAIEWESRPTTEWFAEYAPCLDNLRAALDWAFSLKGDAAIGRSITVAATLLWFQLSLTGECRTRVEQALASLDAEAVAEDDARMRMQLHAALAWSLMYTTDRAMAADTAWAAALDLAEGLEDVDYQLRALWGLWAGSINGGQFGTALTLARRFNNLAASAGDQAEALVGERMMAVSMQFLGEPAVAQRHVERVLANYVAPAHRSHTIRFQFEQRITAGITLGRVLMLQGHPEQAVQVVERTIDDAIALDHTLTLCNALAQACPVALLTGDLAVAERLNALLLYHTATNALAVWHDYGNCFQGQILIQRGDTGDGLSLLGASVDRLRHSGFVQYLTSFLAAFAEALAQSGRAAEGRAAINEALERIERTDERWSLPEMYRVDGDVALAEGGPKAAEMAERLFRRSFDLAAQQGALFWELRAATSLAGLYSTNGRGGDARALLTGVYDRFTEGFHTADLVRAKALLDELGANR